MISEHDRQILSRLPSWNPAGDMVAQRRAWEELAVVYNQDLPAIGALEENVELRAGLRADVAVPKRPGPHPVAIYLHGGGWAFGSPVSFRKLGMQFAEAGYLTIILDYRLAPEHPFPAALEDTVFAIGWAADNARGWNGDGRRIAIGGDSAGANLAASAITSSASELRALVRAALLFYGVYDLTATAQRNRSNPGLQLQLSRTCRASKACSTIHAPVRSRRWHRDCFRHASSSERATMPGVLPTRSPLPRPCRPRRAPTSCT
jgi:acetyl esterase/lipase